jgi:hypothetical protein
MAHRPSKLHWMRMAAVGAACLTIASVSRADNWQPWTGAGSPAASATTDNSSDSQPLAYDIAPAMAQAATADAKYDLAWMNLSEAKIHAYTKFEHSPEYQRAQRELADAQSAYDDASQTVIASLLSDPAYHKLIEKRTQTQIALNQRPGDQGIFNAISQLKMEYSSAASRMEADALAGDIQVRVAKTRLLAAQQVVTEITNRFEDNFAAQPAIASAWRNYQNAIIDQAGAQGYLDGALITRADLNYFNNLKYTPAPNNIYYGAPYYPYGGYGYGYGFTPIYYGYYRRVVRRF